MDKETKEQYDSRLKYYLDLNTARAVGFKEGLKQAREEGENKKNLEIIINMIKKGFSDEDIIGMVKCSTEQIKSARADLQSDKSK